MAMMIPGTSGTPGLTDFGQIQQDEISVLQSIFMEDFCEKEAKTSAWKVSTMGRLADFGENCQVTALSVQYIDVAFDPSFSSKCPLSSWIHVYMKEHQTVVRDGTVSTLAGRD